MELFTKPHLENMTFIFKPLFCACLCFVLLCFVYCFLFWFVFETGSLWAALAGLELAITKLASNSQRSPTSATPADSDF